MFKIVQCSNLEPPMFPGIDQSFFVDTNNLSRVGEQFMSKWQETAADLQSTMTKAISAGDPVSAVNSQFEFSLRNAKRWTDWSDMPAQILMPEKPSTTSAKPGLQPSPNAQDVTAETEVDTPEPDLPEEESTVEAASDDLKRIRGIGPTIEKKLNAMGIRHFDQIAAMTTNDIDELDTHLNFKGRIDRDDWVGQAKQLV